MAVLSPITSDDGWFVGEDKTLDFTVFQADEVTRQNITGWAIRYELLRYKDDDAAIFTEVATITNGAQGNCAVLVPSADTADLEEGTYYHVLVRTDSGSRTVLAFGPVVLQPAPTS